MRNPAAFKMEWSKYTEIGTQFIKASPQPKTIANLLNRVVKMDKQKIKQLAIQSRAWALEYYDSNKNGKKIEEFIDSLSFTNWDTISQNSYIAKNDKYPIPMHIVDDNDFILSEIDTLCIMYNVMYKGVFTYRVKKKVSNDMGLSDYMANFVLDNMLRLIEKKIKDSMMESLLCPI
jgi:hypothetical protein